MSRLFVAGVVLLALGAMLWLLQAVELAQHSRVDAAGRATAELMADAVVGPQIDSAVVAGRDLDTAERARILDAVASLQRRGQLLGLGIWRLDGSPVLAEEARGPVRLGLTPSDRTRARAGVSWTESEAGPVSTTPLRVFVPIQVHEAAAGPGGLVVEAVVPPTAISPAAAQQLRRGRTAAVLLCLLVAAAALGMRRRLRRLDQQARHDPLTGLLNRRGLHADAARAVAVATPQRNAALLLLDLTDFKAVNDTLGHLAGDQLLQKIAATLRARVRPGDLVGRLGGDEFAILVTELADTAAAEARAEYLVALLRAESFTVEGVELHVDASIGVALAPEHGREIDLLLQHAGVAMYQAKRAHRACMVYDPSTDEHTVEQLAMIAELRHAIDNEEFVLHYQPKISLPAGRVTGVEALVRWQHPIRGLVPPGDFLPLLEATGLMTPLTRWVIREAVHQAASWRRAGTPLKVAVNISPRSLLDYDLPARVLAILLAADVPAEFLELEITENAVMTDPQRAAFILTQLRNRGVRVSIDDFGAGYTSLAFLRVLPVSALKVDRGLVTDLLTCPEDEAVTGAVIDLAHRLGFEVVAEGVETAELLERLAELGCDQAQGYLISRPLPAAALEGWLTGHQLEDAVATAPAATPVPGGASGTR